MPSDELISFVVIAYNEEDHIARTLDAIASLDDLGDHYEIVVVDDGSRDKTAPIVKGIAAKNPRVRLIGLSDNRGRGYARSKGVSVTRGAKIATVDADITLPRDWLTRTRDALVHHDAVGGTAIPDGDVSYLAKRFRFTPRKVGHTAAVTGSNALYRRNAFNKAKFDPSLREGEDTALNHNMRESGLSLATVPGLTVWHEEDKSLGTSLKWLFDVGKGATRQLVTYRQVRQPDLAAVGFYCALALGIYATARSHWVAGALIPSAYVAFVSVEHVTSRFEIPRSERLSIFPAAAIDSLLLTSYFAGRAAGIAEIFRFRKRKTLAGAL